MFIAVAQKRRTQCPNAFRVSGTVLQPSRSSKHSCCIRRWWSYTALGCHLAGAWPRASCACSASAVSCCSTLMRWNTDGCWCPSRTVIPLFQPSHELLVRSVPQSVASYTLHTGGGYSGDMRCNCIRIRICIRSGLEEHLTRRNVPRPLRGRFVVPTLGGSVVYVCTKFEADSSFRSKVIRGSQISPHLTPFPGSRDTKFNQLVMVTTFIYRPSLVKIDAHNFELLW